MNGPEAWKKKVYSGAILMMALVLLLLDHSFGAELTDSPPDPIDQIRSKVDYDSKLTDPFCSSRKRHTAKCFTSFQRKQSLDICDAWLDGDTIRLLIYGIDQKLQIIVDNGMFESEYTYNFEQRVRSDLLWITRRQKLTLDKKAYRKGDIIKGRIDFECAQEHGNPELFKKYGRNPMTVTVKGVFKTVLK